MKIITVTVLLSLLSVPAAAGQVSAKTNLVRGTIISADDVSVDIEAGETRESVLRPFVGQEVKRTIYSGQKIHPGLIGAPVLVRRNSRVSMVYKYGPLEISAFGRALDEGGVGDIISVMNLDSRTRVSGVVRKAGFVEVKL